MMKRTALIVAALLASATAVQAAGMLTGANGMTLYTFDQDTGGVSACYDDCAVNWPPYLGTAADPVVEGWALVARTDGTMQWTYDSMPLYYFIKDAAKGDVTGDGVGGVWHIIVEE